MNRAIGIFTKRICDVLADKADGIYLFGSAVLDDYRHGWSDIDILCLTNAPLSDGEAESLVGLRQTLLAEEPDDPYFRRFEGAVLPLEGFLTGNETKTVYWGTSGQRITDSWSFDVFSMFGLIKHGRLLYGTDRRAMFPLPSYEELRGGVREHCETIRRYARETDERLYSCGWLLDISRCIFTLRYGDVIAKTAAGEWALGEKLCPDGSALRRTLEVRRDPLKYKDSAETREWLCSLGPTVQRYADVLENELISAEEVR